MTKTSTHHRVSVASGLSYGLAVMEKHYQAAVDRGAGQSLKFPNKCAYCQVRGLCKPYWQSLKFDGQAPDQSPFIDYTPTKNAKRETAALGIYIRDHVFGMPSVLHLPQGIVEQCGKDLGRLRILSLRRNVQAENSFLILTEVSEIYCE